MILTSVNVALYRMTMSKAAGEQEEERRLSVKEQQKKRGQLLMTLMDFLQSSVDKEKNLEETLQWLKDISMLLCVCVCLYLSGHVCTLGLND